MNHHNIFSKLKFQIEDLVAIIVFVIFIIALTCSLSKLIVKGCLLILSTYILIKIYKRYK